MNESLNEAGCIFGGLLKSGGAIIEWEVMRSEIIKRNERGNT